MSTFADVPLASPNAVFFVTESFNKDTSPDKVNMGVGAYRDGDGKPMVLPVVRKAELIMANDADRIHEYLPIDGLKSFTSAMSRLVLGSENRVFSENRVAAVQCISGTGSLRIAMVFLRKFYSSTLIAVSNPTWANHSAIIREAGLTQKDYRYYNEETRGFNFEGMMQDLKDLPDKTIVLLHACAHNPTGVDPSKEQWEAILNVVEQKQLFPLFDIAYQGLASGDLVKDSSVVRMFTDRNIELLVCQSCSKNFGLYDERAGCLTCVLKDERAAKACQSQIKLIIRPMYSNPPAHGATVVSTILNDEALRKEWEETVTGMSCRILSMRKALHQNLITLKTPGDWSHVVNQNGMFTYTGLNPEQVARMTNDFHIYLMKTGRVNMCGLNEHNVEYVAKAIHKVVTGE